MSKKQLFWMIAVLVIMTTATVLLVIRVIQLKRENQKYSEDCLKNEKEKIDPVTGDRYKECFGEVVIIGTTKERKEISKPESKTLEKINSLPLYTPQKVRAKPEQQELINYAFTETACRGDEKFVTMIEGESKWNPWAVEKLNDGSNGEGLGACQVDRRHWPKIHASKKFRTDKKYQIRVCCELWQKGVRFYGADRNSEMISRFRWPSRV